jgi:hypothetical protein
MPAKYEALLPVPVPAAMELGDQLVMAYDFFDPTVLLSETAIQASAVVDGTALLGDQLDIA